MTSETQTIEETKKVFQPYYKEPLSNSDALEIHHALVGFFELLLRLDKKNKCQEKRNITKMSIVKNINKKGGH